MAAAGLIAFLAVQSAVWFAWWRWLRAHATGLTDAERLLCALLLGIAQVVAVSLLLGWLGWLAPRPLFIAVLGSAGLLARTRARRADHQADGAGSRFAALRGIRAGRAVLLLGGLFTIALAMAVMRDALLPDAGWDGLRYHLPMIALMRQTHGLDFSAVHNPVIAAYPKDIELWSHWILAFFGHDRWVDLAQLPCLLLAILATYAIARRLGSRRAAAAFGALLPGFAPVVLMQITTAYTDLAQSALLLTVVALLLAWRDAASPGLGLSLGAALGLLLGSKFSGAAFALLLLAALALLTWRAHGRRHFAALVGVALLALLLGGETYARNWRCHGNPVFPYQVSVAGLQLPGPWPATGVYGFAETRELSPFERQRRSWAAIDIVHHSTLFGGFGVVGPFLAVVSAVSLALALRDRDTARLAVFALFATLFAVTPLSFRLRFVIYLLGLGGVSLGHLLDRAAPRPRVLLVGAGLAVAAISTVQYGQYTLADRWRDPGVWSRRADVCRDAGPAQFRPAYAWLRQTAAPDSRIVVYRGPDELSAYCLWTPRVDTRVEFAATDDLTAAGAETLLFLPHRSPAYAHFAAADPSQWRIRFADDAVTIVSPK
ncbi:MAG: glycosyltransferase family 39 protein [bacterium]